MCEMRGCEGEGRETASSDARESKTIMKVLMVERDCRVNISICAMCC